MINEISRFASKKKVCFKLFFLNQVVFTAGNLPGKICIPKFLYFRNQFHIHDTVLLCSPIKPAVGREIPKILFGSSARCWYLYRAAVSRPFGACPVPRTHFLLLGSSHDTDTKSHFEPPRRDTILLLRTV